MTASDNTRLVWYFDFISPFAYLQFKQLQSECALRTGLAIEYRPVLFAGLLKHHGHKGPAEIPAKRQMTYRYCHWYAKSRGIAFNMPAAHPFNPLPLLRLALARQCDEQLIARLFDHVWVDSAGNPDFATIDALSALDGLENTAELVADPAIKSALADNTQVAIDRGVFGVPTIAIRNELFWGVDMTEMALTCLDNPGTVNDAEFRRLGNLPVGQARR